MSCLIKTPSLPRKALLGLGIIVLAAGFTGQTAAGITGSSGRAFSACQPFPKVAVWRNLTHDSVRTQVEREYDDDWSAYIGRLEVYGNQLRRIQARGKAAKITRGGRNVRLQGDALVRFLGYVDERIAVTRCLAENQADDLDVAGIADFSTAAGGAVDERAGPKKAVITETAVIRTRPTKRRKTPNNCGSIPQVDWWTFKTPDTIARYVARKYKGNWTAYNAKWDERLQKLKDIQSRGAGAVTKNGSTLRGPSLSKYIQQTQTRVDVTRCLAK